MDFTRPATFTSLALGGALLIAFLGNAYLHEMFSVFLAYAGGRYAVFIGLLSVGLAVSVYCLIFVLSFRPIRLVYTLVFLLFITMTYTMTAAFVGVPFKLLRVEISNSGYFAAFGPGPLYDPELAHGIIVSGMFVLLLLAVVVGTMHWVDLRYRIDHTQAR
jgi:hypothetical protein